jgi:hydrogenase expression/formation protein HypD
MLLMNPITVKYIDEYRNRDLISQLSDLINKDARGSYTFMEVCGGHSSAIRRYGLPSILPQNIKLISGPGCPVCVTDNSFIDKAVAYSTIEGVIITTFGDLIRVPGSESSLARERSRGADIRVVFSGLEALEIARENPGAKVIFLGIGFETTAPGTAVTIKEAERQRIRNFFLLCAHKVMPPAMEEIIKEGVLLNGFICPGHVAAITGSDIFNFIPSKYKIGCVVSGFEPLDILQSVYFLVRQVNRNSPDIEIQYKRVVTREGNIIARKHMEDVFELSDTSWRGLGTIGKSGMKLRSEYNLFDAEIALPPVDITVKENRACICGEILRGLKTPDDCELFGISCFPESPAGACMVSAEGSCNAYYKYKGYE